MATDPLQVGGVRWENYFQNRTGIVKIPTQQHLTMLSIVDNAKVRFQPTSVDTTPSTDATKKAATLISELNNWLGGPDCHDAHEVSMEDALCSTDVFVAPSNPVPVRRQANARLFGRVADVLLMRDRAQILYSIVSSVVIDVVNNIRLSAVVKKPRNTVSKILLALNANPVIAKRGFAPDYCASPRCAAANLPSQVTG